MTYPTPGPNVPYGPDHGQGQAHGYGYGYDPRMARAAQLAESARNWLIVCAIGWFVGFMWITGPLAWYQAGQLARDFHTMGLPPPSEVTNLRLLGIITTVVVLVGLFFLLVVFAALLGGVFVFGGR